MQTTLSNAGRPYKKYQWRSVIERTSLYTYNLKRVHSFLPMCTQVGSCSAEQKWYRGANVRRYSRFSFARLPIHLVASYHDRPSIQVHRGVGTYNGCIERSTFRGYLDWRRDHFDSRINIKQCELRPMLRGERSFSPRLPGCAKDFIELD